MMSASGSCIQRYLYTQISVIPACFLEGNHVLAHGINYKGVEVTGALLTSDSQGHQL